MNALTYYKATSVEDAYQKLIENEKNVVLGGGLWLKRVNTEYNTLVDLQDCELNTIKENDDEFVVGSMVSLRNLEISNLGQNYFNGVVGDALSQIMGVPLRNSATIGGSIMGRFPFSDIITPLLTLDVTLEMYPARQVALVDFLKEKTRNKEILVAIHVKKVNGTALFKKAKLTELGFAIVNLCVAKINNNYRISVGARPGVASLAVNAMDLLNTNTVTDEIISKASEMVVEELKFLNTNGNSKDYRAHLARVYVSRYLKEIK